MSWKQTKTKNLLAHLFFSYFKRFYFVIISIYLFIYFYIIHTASLSKHPQRCLIYYNSTDVSTHTKNLPPKDYIHEATLNHDSRDPDLKAKYGLPVVGGDVGCSVNSWPPVMTPMLVGRSTIWNSALRSAFTVSDPGGKVWEVDVGNSVVNRWLEVW